MSSPGTIAVIHNRYRQPGGEDAAVASHVAVLEQYGHRVVRFESSNETLATMGAIGQASATIWNRAAGRDIHDFLVRERPAVAHFHNTFPLLSPAVHSAAQRAGIPVIQTLHNYRTICPNGILFRDGAVCEACVPKRVKWPGIVHACYRDSRAASAATVAMLAVRATRGMLWDDVNAYIALTPFARARFIAGGLPGARIVVQPGFLAADPGIGSHVGGYGLFVGRLSPEKGVATLLGAWSTAYRDGMRLRIVGTGPLDTSLSRAVLGVEWHGARDNAQVLAMMKEAAFLVCPSECYEGFPNTVLEAFATALPVLASNHGAMSELVTHASTGHLFRPNDPADLARSLSWAFDNPTLLPALGNAGRREFESKYTASHGYARLRELYARVTSGVAA